MKSPTDNFTKIYLDEAGFKVPSAHGGIPYTLEFEGATVLTADLTIQAVPEITSLSPMITASLFPTRFRVFVNPVENYSIVSYVWDINGEEFTTSENVKISFNYEKTGFVTIAIDPENIIISNNKIESSALNCFYGTIKKIEDFGDSLQLSVEDGAVFSALITRKSFFDMNLNIGNRVWLTFKANAVKVTLGPKGRNVVLDKSFGAPTITKDGVSVAKEIELEDKFQNMGAQMVKEVASQTSDVAGDGTTTATVLAQSILNEGLKAVAAGMNPMDLKRGIDKAIHAAVDAVTKTAVPCTDSAAIAQVGSISEVKKSSNNLPETLHRSGRVPSA